MLISVVIPAFNAENWIVETLRSVSSQTYNEFEIVVVDDGSTDKTMAIAERCLAQSTRPHRFIRQANRGAAAARNHGIEVANGDWIQFLDADDLLDTEKLEIQAASLATEQAVDVVYSDWCKWAWNGGEWAESDQRKPTIQSDALADVLSDRNFLQLGCMLFRKSMLSAVGGFDTEHEPIEDVGLCVKIAMAGGRFCKAASDKPLAFYRDLPKSFSKWNHCKFIESCVKNAKLAETKVQAGSRGNTRSIDAIVDVYYEAARFYAGLNWSRFDELVGDIEALKPDFIPASPARLRVLSQIAGYRRAERLAAFYRRGRQFHKAVPEKAIS